MTYFDQIDPINDIFDQSYANKPENVINGVNLVKIGHFYENCQYWVILAPKMTQYDVIGQNLGKVVKKSLL